MPEPGSILPIGLNDVSTILYFNDNFSGGELRFGSSSSDIHDSFTYSMKPEPGMLVIFPSTKEYGHGVTRVSEGNRYVSPMFWTRSKTFALASLPMITSMDWQNLLLWPEKVDILRASFFDESE